MNLKLLPVLLLIVATSLIISCSGGKFQATPVDVANSFFAEIESLSKEMKNSSPQESLEKNAQKLFKYTCYDDLSAEDYFALRKDAFAEAAPAMAENMSSYCPIKRFSVGEVEFDGKDATVKIAIETTNSKNFSGYVEVKKIDDKWYIEDLDFDEVEESAFASEDVDQSESETSATETQKWDKFIDQYDKVLKNYLELAKKAKSNDQSVALEAALECVELLPELEKLQTHISKAEGEMTPNQVARFTKLMGE